MNDCVFCKIIARQLAADIVYEDEHCIAFLNNMPVNPGHMLVTPKAHTEAFRTVSEDALQALIVVSQKMAAAARKATDAPAINLFTNDGEEAGQVIKHLHFHIIPRFADDGCHHWPGTPYADGEAQKMLAKIQKALG